MVGCIPEVLTLLLTPILTYLWVSYARCHVCHTCQISHICQICHIWHIWHVRCSDIHHMYVCQYINFFDGSDNVLEWDKPQFIFNLKKRYFWTTLICTLFCFGYKDQKLVLFILLYYMWIHVVWYTSDCNVKLHQ